jgi:SEC-C motif-containing protein
VQTLPDDARRCPCGTGESFGACCGRYLVGLGHGEAAPTAEALMRSRYTAFAVGDVQHLLQTWHASTRPGHLDLDPGLKWLHLSIDSTSEGGPFHDRGVVEFTAVYRSAAGRGEQHEVSRFVRERGRWYYVDGAVD